MSAWPAGPQRRNEVATRRVMSSPDPPRPPPGRLYAELAGTAPPEHGWLPAELDALARLLGAVRERMAPELADLDDALARIEQAQARDPGTSRNHTGAVTAAARAVEDRRAGLAQRLGSPFLLALAEDNAAHEERKGRLATVAAASRRRLRDHDLPALLARFADERPATIRPGDADPVRVHSRLAWSADVADRARLPATLMSPDAGALARLAVAPGAGRDEVPGIVWRPRVQVTVQRPRPARARNRPDR